MVVKRKTIKSIIICVPGQAGKGNSEEFGLLSLEFDENFCMGGPGVILSSETLRRGIFITNFIAANNIVIVTK